MNTARCPHPRRCGAATHRVGSAAALGCAALAGAGRPAATGAPAPPAPAGVQEVTTTRESRHGFVEDGDAIDAVVTRHLLGGELHRVGAPAKVVVDMDGVVVEEHWYERGAPHRGDGPALMRVEFEGPVESYYYRGRYMGYGRDARKMVDQALAAGAKAHQVAGWIGLPRSVVLALAPVVEDPQGLQQAWDAGVREPSALVAVAARRAPASWAGASRR